MRRKTVQQLTLSGASRARVARRKAQESGELVLGVPVMPPGREKNWRRTWGKVSQELLAAKKVFLADANLLVSLIDALRGSRIGSPEERTTAHVEAQCIRGIFDSRKPFEEVKPVEVVVPVVAGPTLAEFIEQVKQERETFVSRMLPGETVTLDSEGKIYSWPAGDAAQIAREYAQQVVQGAIVAGELVVFACARFLKELEMGHERGFYFDPLAARNIKTWFDVFGSWQIQPWQIFCAVQLFAWKRPAGTRRFSRFWLAVGRKNGKSSFLAHLGLFCLIADQTDRAEVYSAATKKDQAHITWADAEYNVRHNAELARYTKSQRYVLSVEDTGSFFQYLGSDKHTLDGLRPSCCLIDEIHEHNDDGVVKRLQSGTLSRSQPLLLFATTAGESRESWCYTQHEIFERILRGTVEEYDYSDSWLLYIAQMDSTDAAEDETKWVKSNPSLGITLTLESLRVEASALKADPASIFSFTRFHCNIWNSVVVGHSLPQDAINACIGCELPPGGAMELRNTFLAKAKTERTLFFGALDLGLSDDMCAFVLLTPHFCSDLTVTGDYKKKTAIIPWFFIPAKRLKEHEANWRVPLSLWVREGWVTVAGEELVDMDEVEKTIKQICSDYRVPVIGFDKWKTETLCARMNSLRVAKFVAVPQIPSYLTAPSMELKTAVLKGTLAHLANPVLKWHLSNVDLEPDEKTGGIRPKKYGGDRRCKIDACQATVTAWQQLLDVENRKFFNTPKIFML
jgi:phage terminase large subunit-like protein